MANSGPREERHIWLHYIILGISTLIAAFVVVFYCKAAQYHLNAALNQTTEWFWHNMAVVMWIGSLLVLACAVRSFVLVVVAAPEQIPSGARICTAIVCYVVSALGAPLAISFPEHGLLALCGIVASGIVGTSCVFSLTSDEDPPKGAVEVMVRPHCLELRQAKEGELCPICLDSFAEGEEETTLEPDAVAALKCGHGFHQHCVEVWLLNTKSNARCPVCRQSSFAD